MDVRNHLDFRSSERRWKIKVQRSQDQHYLQQIELAVFHGFRLSGGLLLLSILRKPFGQEVNSILQQEWDVIMTEKTHNLPLC